MSNLEIAFLVFGVIASLLFLAGYIRGARIALSTYDDPRIEVDDTGDVQSFWWQIAAAVALATVIIAMVGIIPEFVYVGPALAIVTAGMNGLAFFIEDRPKKWQ